MLLAIVCSWDSYELRTMHYARALRQFAAPRPPVRPAVAVAQPVLERERGDAESTRCRIAFREIHAKPRPSATQYTPAAARPTIAATPITRQIAPQRSR